MDGVIRVKFSMLLRNVIRGLTPLTSLPIESETLENDTLESNAVTKALTTRSGLIQLAASYTRRVTGELVISQWPTVV